ncbi:TRAPP I complex [Piedraia hortae CBS 480.64]|uniref:Trafficking protein particle complex subunit n=1 Tax=Piedraia hortae CBS 480.64 TaxID=1314780 RepID=A0A6A7C9B8_9PEZI|nr:TRAPP I complex [Piedraia hortae CBS 480.64]
MPGVNSATGLDFTNTSQIPLPPPKPFTPSLRQSSARKSIYDRNLQRPPAQSSLPAFAFLFNTIINYHHRHSASVAEIETRLNRAGYPIGVKMLDLIIYRLGNGNSSFSSAARGLTGSSSSSAGPGRPIRLLELLQFIHTHLFRTLFGRPADALEQSTTKKNEYMLIEHEPIVNTYISIPKEMSQLNCAAFVAGIIEGCCDAAGFSMEGVSAHWAGNGGGSGSGEEEMWPDKTIYLLRFSDEVIEREEARGG